MSYYIRAYNRDKHINLQVEEKHQYYHTFKNSQFYNITLPQKNKIKNFIKSKKYGTGRNPEN